MDDTFPHAVERWLAALPPAALEQTIAGVALLRLPGNEPPWRGTGLRVAAGQAYSLFGSGRILWSARAPERYGGPRFHLWARIAPGGRIVNLTQNTGSFVADVNGEIELGIYMGLWQNDTGDLKTGAALYERLQGHIDALVVAWRGEPGPALAALVRHRPDSWFITDELVRLAAPIAPPAGWQYLLETGQADIFMDARGEDDRRVIKLDARDDQGIICTPVDCALTPATTLHWRWRVTLHPSETAEDTAPTHDYISIATEFDNGRDLTWIWSSQLAPETHFHCPIKAWTARETHFVVRTGADALGKWCEESRNVYADVGAAMGAPPARIVRVWLIGVSSFQHGHARAEFSDIALHTDSGSTHVL